MLEQLEHAVGMKNVPTSKLHARLSLQLTCVANGAEFIAVWQTRIIILTGLVETGKALILTLNTTTTVATGLNQLAPLDEELIFILRIAL